MSKDAAAARARISQLEHRVKSLEANLSAALVRIDALAAQIRQGRQRGAGRSQATSRLSLLSTREREVLSLYVADPNDKHVARQLGRAVQTVRNQLASIKRKLGVDSRHELLISLTSLGRVKASGARNRSSSPRALA